MLLKQAMSDSYIETFACKHSTFLAKDFYFVI